MTATEPTPLPIPPDVEPFTLAEIVRYAESGTVQSLEAIVARIETCPGWPGATGGSSARTAARVVRALAAWAAMDDTARRLADPIWHSTFSEDHRHVSARVVGLLSEQPPAVVWAALAALVECGLIPGTIEHLPPHGRTVTVHGLEAGS